MYQTLKNESGAMLLTILVAVVAVGLAAGIAGSTWQTITQRAKEAELLWRGDQYRKAIESYYLQSHGGAKLFPNNLEALVKDPRSLAPLRHIRQVYKDPMTGEDFVLVKQGGKVVGVKSSSDLEPFKKDGFPEEYDSFTGAATYADWQFVYSPKNGKKTTVADPKKAAPAQQLQ